MQENPEVEEKMKVWFDTEFYEDGRVIELISIGAVREDGQTFYAQSPAAQDLCRTDWLKKNVMPWLPGGRELSRASMALEFYHFAGPDPEFWAYYCSYDWVCLCQLYGRMIELPTSWPRYCRDVKQLCDEMGDPRLPKQTTPEHHALNDALWTRDVHKFLMDRRH